jgi:hypothetical protein
MTEYTIEDVKRRIQELDKFFADNKWTRVEVLGVFSGVLIEAINSFPEETRERALFDTINPIMEHFGYDTVRE